MIYDSFLDIYFPAVITFTTMKSYVPLSIPNSIPSVTLPDVVVLPSTTNYQPAALVETASSEPTVILIFVPFSDLNTSSTTFLPINSASDLVTPSISITQITIPIPTHIVSQPVPLVTASEMSTPTVEATEKFGEDAMVSIGEYFSSKSKKVVVKKGYKRAREGTLV